MVTKCRVPPAPLDREQNDAFRDHYLELPLDLSQVFFVATANDTSRIPPPLRDRMEVIRIPSDTDEEKVEIVRHHLLPRQLALHGLKPAQLSVSDAAVGLMIRGHTREPGVRELERKVAQVCRKALRTILQHPESACAVTEENIDGFLDAPRTNPRWVPDEPQVGVCLGLSVSESGGSLVPFEVACVPGNGQLILTGGLGEQMRDSAQAALSWVKAFADDLGVPRNFRESLDIHLHITGGAPKNGPSGGVPIAVAMVSALTGRPVRHDIAMTGELSLMGRILPVGGVREKVLACSREESIRQVFLPKANCKEISDLPASVREAGPDHPGEQPVGYYDGSADDRSADRPALGPSVKRPWAAPTVSSRFVVRLGDQRAGFHAGSFQRGPGGSQELLRIRDVFPVHIH